MLMFFGFFFADGYIYWPPFILTASINQQWNGLFERQANERGKIKMKKNLKKKEAK